jgi:hypothetical protein
MSWEDIRRWAQEQYDHNENGKRLIESENFVGIISPKFFEEPHCALQIGLAVLHDKPIFLLVSNKVKVPALLEKVAAKIVYADFEDKDGLAGAMDAIKKFVLELEIKK